MEVESYKDRAALHFHNRKQEICLYIYYTFTISNGSQFHPIIAVLFRYHYISKRLCPLRLPCWFKGVTNITNRSREKQCDLSEPQAVKDSLYFRCCCILQYTIIIGIVSSILKFQVQMLRVSLFR